MLIHQDFDAVRKTAVIKLNRPEKLNALTFDLAQELVNALDAIEKNSAVRCVIITGEGKAFCAGSDLAARLSQDLPIEGVEGDPYLRALRRMNKRITDLPVPVIAAINGHAIGGGLELALACDIRVASQSAKLGLGEVKVGAMAGGGGTQRLPRLVGMGNALEMMFTGEPINGIRAAEIGLVNVAVPAQEVLNYSLSMAEKISNNAPLSLAAVKKAAYKGEDLPLESGLDTELFYAEIIAKTQDRAEGMRAFLEKRPPSFVGN